MVDLWYALPRDSDRFALVYQSKDMVHLSQSVHSWFFSEGMQQLVHQGGTWLLLKTLGSAFALPLALLSATNMIDGQWAVVSNRSDKAGVLLAEVLVQRLHGPRPVSLVGFSMGARVIFSCLSHLSTNYSKEETRGLIEQVVLLGAPVAASHRMWPKIRELVAGRIVNGYCSKDWVLGLMFRTSFLLSGVAGIQPVCVQGVQNVDLTSLVPSHADYGLKLDAIFDTINFCH